MTTPNKFFYFNSNPKTPPSVKPTQPQQIPHLKNRLFLLKYTEPIEKDMAVIMVYFNCQQSLRIIQNLLYVKNMLDHAKIPYFIGEMSIAGSPFLFDESATIFHFQSQDNMFYKENLINLLEPLIPATYTKLCMLDADILFDNRDWYTLLSEKLNKVTICQPFQTAYWLNISYNEIILNCDSYLKDNINGHSGFAWAFNRKWFNTYKFPCDSTFIGGGDSIFIKSVLDRKIMPQHTFASFYLTQYIKALPLQVTSDYLNLDIFHMYHGTIQKRQYNTRFIKFNELLTTLKITDVKDIIEYNSKNVMQWKPRYRDVFNAFVKTYLTGRDDDGI